MGCAGPGSFVAVVGPSGVGKDSVISYAAARLAGRPDFVFVKRVVTRQADPSSEDHDSLSEADFAAAAAAGRFAVSWQAHGHCYGLPAEVDNAIERGATVIANVSRRMLDQLEMRYTACPIVAITARPQVLRERLLARGREDAEAIDRRLAAAARPVVGRQVTSIDNSSALEVAGEAFVALLLATRTGQPVAAADRS